MKHIYRSLLVCMIALVSCKDPDAGPIFLYGDLEGGTYIRLVEKSDELVDLDNFSSYTYTYTVEFVNADGGANVESYSLDLIYKRGKDTKTVEDFRVVQASDFSTNDDGFTRVSITVTSAELLNAFNLADISALAPEDEFQFKGEIVTPTNTFNSVNSSATVEGAFFQGYFDFTLFVGCKSSLQGTYPATTTAINCRTGEAGSASVSFMVKIEDEENSSIGEYSFSDATFGVLEDCFGDGDKTLEAQTGFTFKDVCGKVSFDNTTDLFGVDWNFTSVVNGDNWEITWSNPDTGLAGVTVIKFPDKIDFTVN